MTEMEQGDIPEGWEPPPPPEVGSSAWKDDMALTFILTHYHDGMPKRNAIYRLPVAWGRDEDGVRHPYQLGWMSVHYTPGSGYDYFRVDSLVGM